MAKESFSDFLQGRDQSLSKREQNLVSYQQLFASTLSSPDITLLRRQESFGPFFKIGAPIALALTFTLGIACRGSESEPPAGKVENNNNQDSVPGNIEIATDDNPIVEGQITPALASETVESYSPEISNLFVISKDDRIDVSRFNYETIEFDERGWLNSKLVTLGDLKGKTHLVIFTIGKSETFDEVSEFAIGEIFPNIDHAKQDIIILQVFSTTFPIRESDIYPGILYGANLDRPNPSHRIELNEIDKRISTSGSLPLSEFAVIDDEGRLATDFVPSQNRDLVLAAFNQVASE